VAAAAAEGKGTREELATARELNLAAEAGKVEMAERATEVTWGQQRVSLRGKNPAETVVVVSALPGMGRTATHPSRSPYGLGFGI
jgi:Mrp family chromosome partitioning ATPase